MSPPPYDPGARRATPLALKLVQHIRTLGPISVSDYVHHCLHDPDHGYYRLRPAIGRGGDFITAPEISQVFGELIGLWCAVVWQQMGSPARLQLVEIGPGRGVLMQDALRAATMLPAFRQALDVHLIETSALLAATQRSALMASGVPVQWHAQFDWTPDAPVIVIANELLDTLPVGQWVRHGEQWCERMVGLDNDGSLTFLMRAVPGTSPETPFWLDTGSTEIAERQAFTQVTRALGALARPRALAALLVDYGHTAPLIGDTLQAVRGHAFEHPLTSPGEADLSCQVDFSAFITQLNADAAPGALAVDGPTTQAELLGRLGIVERASRLMAANPGKAAAIEAGIVRLMAPNGMGTRFKAVGLRSTDLAPLPGFAGS